MLVPALALGKPLPALVVSLIGLRFIVTGIYELHEAGVRKQL
jgi:hypothetical protein